MIRIVLVDDQELFRGGVRVVLDAQPDMEVCGEAANGLEALNVIEATRPDVILLDMRMPVMDGVETVRALFGPEGPEVPPKVIVLTTFALDAAAATAIRAGASGFLLKDSTPAFLTAAIRAVDTGSAVIAPDELDQLFSADVAAAPIPAKAPVPLEFRSLTTRERAIFDLAARGLSNAEIAAREFVSESTVKSHISAVLGKLSLRDRVQLVVYAHDNKLLDGAV
ncbi:LuxR family transcriptional regulator [Frondihabitans sp. PAMC 28766]|uniref:response regulator transcription factor n=1 Tax=Frondihabitans sp. PAMC 28766 TaxID=1795630 RepID=UPI00078DC56C|nr:response regulator transcription factor [Frondihabitans sp. PAMC 28766]AMM20052.1 LuxR family transcriptional regulator [Frondihabitans sp. PAMC 28766]